MKWIVLILLSIVSIVAIGCNETWHPKANCAKTNTSCDQNADCCSFACLGNQCACANVDDPCQIDDACCNGLVCQEGRCAVGCRDDGASCESNFDCCSNTCDETGTCVPRSCAPEGTGCASDTECCTGNCEGLTTCRCAPLGHACTTSDQCCTGMSCDVNGQCRYTMCQSSPSAECIDPSDCCGGGCEASTCCSQQNVACTGPGTCCGTFICASNTQRCEPCRAVGAACTFGGEECCAPSACNSANKCCQPAGGTCVTSSDCCTNETCSTTTNTCCRAPAAACTLGTQCCSGVCNASNVCN